MSDSEEDVPLGMFHAPGNRKFVTTPIRFSGDVWSLFKQIRMRGLEMAFCTYCGRTCPDMDSEVFQHVKDCTQMRQQLSRNSVYERVVSEIVTRELEEATHVKLENPLWHPQADNTQKKTRKRRSKKKSGTKSGSKSASKSSRIVKGESSARKRPAPKAPKKRGRKRRKTRKTPTPVPSSSPSTRPSTALSRYDPLLAGIAVSRDTSPEIPDSTPDFSAPLSPETFEDGPPNAMWNPPRSQEALNPVYDPSGLRGLQSRISKFMAASERPPSEINLTVFRDLIEYAWGADSEEHLDDFWPNTKTGLDSWIDSFCKSQKERPAEGVLVTLSVLDWSVKDRIVYGIVLIQNSHHFLQDVLVLDEQPKTDELLSLVMDSLKGIHIEDVSAFVTTCEVELMRLRKAFTLQFPGVYELPCVDEVLDYACSRWLSVGGWSTFLEQSVSVLAPVSRCAALVKKLGRRDLGDVVLRQSKAVSAGDRFAASYECFAVLYDIFDDLSAALSENDPRIGLSPQERQRIQTVFETRNFKPKLRVFQKLFGSLVEAVKTITRPDAGLSACFSACVSHIHFLLPRLEAASTLEFLEFFTPLFELVLERPVFLLAAFLDLDKPLKFTQRVLDVVRAEYRRLMSMQGKSAEELEVSVRQFESFAAEHDHLTKGLFDSRPEYEEIRALKDFLSGICPRSLPSELSVSVCQCVNNARRSKVDDATMERTVRHFFTTHNAVDSVEEMTHKLRDLTFEDDCSEIEQRQVKSVGDLASAEAEEDTKLRASRPGYPINSLRESRPRGGLAEWLGAMFVSFPEE